MADYPHPNLGLWNIQALLLNRVTPSGYILGDGGTAGKIKITVPLANQDLGFMIAGRYYSLAPGAGTTDSDDFFDCSGFTDLAAATYCKVLLEISTAGAALATQGDNAASQALALLPKRTVGYAMLGWLEVAGATDWDDAGGLAGQGVTYRMGIAAAL